MKLFKLFVFVFFAMALTLTTVSSSAFQIDGPAEAPAGFDGETNGLVSQNVHAADEAAFVEQKGVGEGLGPVYNAQSCRECHQNPVLGGVSHITELRAGTYSGSVFFEHPGGSLIHSYAIDTTLQEQLLGGNEVRAFRTSLNTLGDGFVEAIADETLIALANSQPPGMRGQVVYVPVLEAGGALRVGRFGWKNQHASLVSFSADSYLNEMGITSPLQPNENTSNGNSVAAFDRVPDPEDNGDDVETFARFMRATKVPPRDLDLAATPEAKAGADIFNSIGCAHCHTPRFTTTDVGASINGGRFIVPAALGNKIIHPFGDFLLHDVGTGDGIVQNGPPSTRNKLRTPPLWGVRTRNRFMHDGLSLTFNEAILRHAGEALPVINNYRALSQTNKDRLTAFLNSL